MHEQHNQLTAGGPTRVNPLTVPMLIPDAAAGQVAIDLAYMVGRTPQSQPAHQEAMMLAQMLLNDGGLIWCSLAAPKAREPTRACGLLRHAGSSCRNDDPEQASRPYSKDRDGFVPPRGPGCWR